MKRFMCFCILSTLLGATVLSAEMPAKAADPSIVQTQGKLDKILLNQLEILRQLDEIKKELAIVKARATR